MPCSPRSAIDVTSGYVVRVPHDHQRADLQRGDDRHQRRVLPGEDLPVGRSEGERDGVVGVHQRLDVAAPGCPAGADLDVDAGRLALRDQRSGDDLVVGVDLVVVAEEVVHGAVLRLGEPVGLDHDRLRAHVAEVDRLAGGGAGGWLGRRRWRSWSPGSATGRRGCRRRRGARPRGAC